ncbi:uncharacterized protein Tco025E_07463 [Trypanosoma conorhini]|uniref:PH-like domain-containing protein n=1 Tax=Trypanosoma conorhini TaxID=83891 RepID=A0A3R7KIA5_9TRYP|nr:uncharacterized protein Tco025E_07463 [Trypanosoma conorhini]RNF07015.1 hypothetical protein Tco025E_07463 [Trypanosoma conorhini]
MSRGQHTPRGRPAEVEDSIHFLQHYLRGAAPASRPRPASSPPHVEGAAAAGVLPASVVPGEWGTQGWARGAASPVRAPLRLQYGPTAAAPAGRPPLPHYHQQQRQQLRRDGTTGLKGASTGAWEDASPRATAATTGREWTRGTNSMRPTYSRTAASYLGRVHGDSPSRLDLDRAEASLYSRHRPHRRRRGSSHNAGLVEYGTCDDTDEEETEDEDEEGDWEEKRRRNHRRGGTAPPTDRDAGPIRGGGARQPRTAGSEHSPERRLNASAAAPMGSGLRQTATLNELSTPSGKWPGERARPQDVFPYPRHEDNLRSVLFYLKNHYALEPQESLRGIETMTPEDVLDLVQCFYVDAYRTVRHARDAAGVGRAGFTEQDPPMDCVAAAPSDAGLPAGAEEAPEEAAAPAPPPHSLPPHNSLTRPAVSRRTPPQQLWRQNAAGPSSSSVGGGAARTPSGRSHPPEHFHAPLEHATSEGANASVLTEGTQLSVEPPQEPGSGIVKRPLRELMPLLRRGSALCKHVEDGRPHMRFFRVEDHLGEYLGEEALMPHLVWYLTAKEKKPVAALNLLSLLGVHLLLADASGQFLKLFRRKKGIVVDHSRRAVASGMCAVFRFESRDVAVSFLTEEDRQLWVGGMMGVVERNRLLAARPC